MDEKSILSRIGELVDEEHLLRARLRAGEISAEEEHTRLRQLEESLDRCWDLLRRHRAARDAGIDPELVEPRSPIEVERYLQ
jgi:hypothetical protein